MLCNTVSINNGIIFFLVVFLICVLLPSFIHPEHSILIFSKEKRNPVPDIPLSYFNLIIMSNLSLYLFSKIFCFCTLYQKSSKSENYQKRIFEYFFQRSVLFSHNNFIELMRLKDSTGSCVKSPKAGLSFQAMTAS